jgi:hypothetical protein
VRHLLVGAWYPLLDCPNEYRDLVSHDANLWVWGDASKHSKPHREWVATQYHRFDLNEGMILAFRRPDSPYSRVQVSPRGIDPAATYEVSWDSRGPNTKMTISGADLSRDFEIILPIRRSSDLIVYRKTTSH